MEENKKLSEEVIELHEAQLGAVTGGLSPVPNTGNYIDALTSAETVCKKCGHPFIYWYHWIGGMHDGPWNHPVPELCPTCDPNTEKERGKN